MNRKPRLQLLHGCVTLLACHLKLVSNWFTFKPVWPNQIQYVTISQLLPLPQLAKGTGFEMRGSRGGPTEAMTRTSDLAAGGTTLRPASGGGTRVATIRSTTGRATILPPAATVNPTAPRIAVMAPRTAVMAPRTAPPLVVTVQ